MAPPKGFRKQPSVLRLVSPKSAQAAADEARRTTCKAVSNDTS